MQANNPRIATFDMAEQLTAIAGLMKGTFDKTTERKHPASRIINLATLLIANRAMTDIGLESSPLAYLMALTDMKEDFLALEFASADLGQEIDPILLDELIGNEYGDWPDLNAALCLSNTEPTLFLDMVEDFDEPTEETKAEFREAFKLVARSVEESELAFKACYDDIVSTMKGHTEGLSGVSHVGVRFQLGQVIFLLH